MHQRGYRFFFLCDGDPVECSARSAIAVTAAVGRPLRRIDFAGGVVVSPSWLPRDVVGAWPRSLESRGGGASVSCDHRRRAVEFVMKADQDRAGLERFVHRHLIDRRMGEERVIQISVIGKPIFDARKPIVAERHVEAAAERPSAPCCRHGLAMRHRARRGSSAADRADLEPLPGEPAGPVHEPGRGDEISQPGPNATVPAFLDTGAVRRSATLHRASPRNAANCLVALPPREIAFEARDPGRCEPPDVTGVATDPGGAAVEALWICRLGVGCGQEGTDRRRGPDRIGPALPERYARVEETRYGGRRRGCGGLVNGRISRFGRADAEPYAEQTAHKRTPLHREPQRETRLTMRRRYHREGALVCVLAVTFGIYCAAGTI